MALQNSLQESGATTLLKRAVELDREGRLHESLISYQAGLEQLLQVLKGVFFIYLKNKIISSTNLFF